MYNYLLLIKSRHFQNQGQYKRNNRMQRLNKNIKMITSHKKNVQATVII